MASDKYANIATVSVTESAADTLTFQELRTQAGIDSSRKKATALIIDEIDYQIERATLGAMGAASDSLMFAITLSNAITDLLDISDRRILHAGYIMRQDFGTAGSAGMFQSPLVYQFFPPLITADRSLYLGVQGAATGIANTLRVRIYHRVAEITEGEFIELAEVFRLVG